MVRSILMVCTGNICRSPLAKFALAGRRPDLTVSSAGLHALVGRDMDPDSATAARALGVDVRPHSARQFDSRIGADADLILVMEKHHRDEIMQRWPQYVGKTFLLGQFTDGKGIPDPYRMGQAMHFRAAELIGEAVEAWSAQIEAAP